MKAFELLREDHQKIFDLFNQIHPTEGQMVKDREQIFNNLRREIEVHARLEEQVFYPLLKQAPETRDIAFEAIEDHMFVKQLLNEMVLLPKNSDRFAVKLTSLKDMVERHIEREESEVFDKARYALTQDQLDRLGMLIEAGKKQLVAAARR